MNMVRQKANLSQPRVLTPELKAELQAVAEMPDESIDFSDIPLTDAAFWENAVRNPYYRPTPSGASRHLPQRGRL
jgi:hypothetical protein